MVETIYTSDYRTAAEATHGVPVIQIHHIERHVHGNGIAIKVWGELKIAAKEIVYARELHLNTLQVLLLTVESGAHYMFTAQKYIYHKGAFDNYASIDIYSPSGTVYEMLSGVRQQVAQPAPASLPEDGSIWLNFMALGE